MLLADRLADLAVIEVAATADGFFAFRFDVCRAADGVNQELLDQPRAGATGTGRFGVLLHVIDAEQAVFLNGFDDGALAHTVAAADFGGVGHDHGFVLALMSYVAEGMFAKHQVIADLADDVK